MDENQWLADRFEEHRAHLRAVAYRMLGSLAEADDAVQDAWLRLSRAGAGEVENLGGWLTTVVARICLNVLRDREREEPAETHDDGPYEGTPSSSSAWPVARPRAWITRCSVRSAHPVRRRGRVLLVADVLTPRGGVPVLVHLDERKVRHRPRRRGAVPDDDAAA